VRTGLLGREDHDGRLVLACILMEQGCDELVDGRNGRMAGEDDVALLAVSRRVVVAEVVRLPLERFC